MQLVLKIGRSLFDCETVAELPILSEARKVEEVYGTDTMSFKLYCRCDDPLTIQFLQLQRYRNVGVYAIRECDGKTTEELVFFGYVSSRKVCTSPKKYTYEIELSNYKGLLQEFDILYPITSPVEEDSPLLTVQQVFNVSTVDYTGIVQQIIRCIGFKLSFCADIPEYNESEVELDLSCGDSLYDAIEEIANQLGVIRFIDAICQGEDGIVMILKFTDCFGEVKTENPNSFLCYNGTDSEFNTIEGFCATQTGGGVSCVSVFSSLDTIIDGDPPVTITNNVQLDENKGVDGIPKCIELDNTGNKVANTLESLEEIMREKAVEELDKLCQVNQRYDINMGKNVIDANIGDILKLKIVDTKLDLDVESELTVLRVETIYANCIETQELTLGGEDTPYISISKIKQNLSGLL